VELETTADTYWLHSMWSSFLSVLTRLAVDFTVQAQKANLSRAARAVASCVKAHMGAATSATEDNFVLINRVSATHGISKLAIVVKLVVLVLVLVLVVVAQGEENRKVSSDAPGFMFESSNWRTRKCVTGTVLNKFICSSTYENLRSSTVDCKNYK
jgi:hypothetical protein